MAVYSLGVETITVSAGSCAWEIRTASADRARLLELGLAVGVGSANGTAGIGRPAARGITPTSPDTFLADDPGDPAGTVQSALAWATAPTAPVSFYGRGRIQTGGIVWVFPRAITLAIDSSFVLWNIAAGVASSVWASVDE